VPDSLDVAKQRKLIEDLKRDGQKTQDAESRLQEMLDFITSMRGYRAAALGGMRQKKPSKADPIQA
jgi:hypothetical protein